MKKIICAVLALACLIGWNCVYAESAVKAAPLSIFDIVDAIHDFGYAKKNSFIQDVAEGDITSYAANEDGGRIKEYYVKLGEINEIEGYTMEIEPLGDSENLNYCFYPVEESNIDHFEVRGSFGLAERQVELIYTIESEEILFSDVYETNIHGLPAYVYAYTAASEEVIDGYEKDTLIQNISAYLDYSETHSIAIHVYIEGEDDSSFIAEEDMVEFITPFVEAITVYTGE